MFVCLCVPVFVCLSVCVFLCLCVCVCLSGYSWMGDWVSGWVRGSLFVCRQAECAESHGQKQRVIEERAEMLAGMAWLRDILG